MGNMLYFRRNGAEVAENERARGLPSLKFIKSLGGAINVVQLALKLA